jgi:uncharacterized protein (DUF427 family)
MAKAIWNGAVLAESDDTVVVEGNHYFPREAINAEHFVASDAQTICPWKGTARYFDIVANGMTNAGAAWYYPDPKPAASDIEDRVAFWRGVRVEA